MNDLQYILEREKYENTYKRDCWVMFTVGAIVACTGFMILHACEAKIPKPAHATADCGQCHNKFTTYFKSKGSPTPEVMANAVIRTKSPRLLSAIAVVESNGTHKVRKAGYKQRHSGAWQVSEKDWGKVPHDAIGQALQAERVLEELVRESDGNIVKGLNKYGGDRTKRIYAKNILQELTEVPK